jgi:outer membrane lipoprotein-sorting protein
MAARRVAALWALAAVVGCGPPRVGPAPPQPVSTAEISAERLLAKLDERAGSLRSFRAFAAMRYVGPTDKVAVKEVVAVRRPDHLRIEMMSAFGVALQIASDGERLAAYHRGERTYYKGRASADNLARFTRLELALADIAMLLIGLPPARQRTGSPSMMFEKPPGLWRVSTAIAGGGLETVWFDPDTLLPVRAEETDAGGLVQYGARYASYTDVDGIDVPSEVRFEVPQQSAQIALRYSDISVNGEMGSDLFAFDPPPGARIVDLDTIDAADRRLPPPVVSE